MYDGVLAAPVHIEKDDVEGVVAAKPVATIFAPLVNGPKIQQHETE